MDQLNNRRSIRIFDKAQVSEEYIELLLRAAMQAPTAKNQKAWEFIVVEDKDMLEKLSTVTPYTKLVCGAGLAIIVLANKEKFSAGEFWEQDMAAATQNILTKAVDLNLGTCWMGIAPIQESMNKIRGLFSLDEKYLPFNIIAVGHLAKHVNKFRDNYDTSCIHREKM